MIQKITMKYKLELSKNEAELLAAGLVFCSTVDCCANWNSKTALQFVRLATKLAKQGVTDLSKHLTMPGEKERLDAPQLAAAIRKSFKVKTN